MLLMAIALELAKPLAFSAAFDALKSWSPIRAGLLATLAVVAIAYSLTAELTLMSAARGDLIAKREQTIQASAEITAETTRAQHRYDDARAELAKLASSRPAPEIQAEIDGSLLIPGANGCVVIDGKVTRDVCPKVANLKAEKARAERRTELKSVMAKPITSPTSTPSVHEADPEHQRFQLI